MPAIQFGNTAYAASVLLAIFENIRRQNNKNQLFLKIMINNHGGLQDIFYKILVSHGPYFDDGNLWQFTHLKNLFVFSDKPDHSCPQLVEAIRHLGLAGMISWPDQQEPYLMRMEQAASRYYEEVLLRNTPQRMAYEDVLAAQYIAKIFSAYWPQSIMNRSHLINLTQE